jgi:iron complex outermembrane recepter protein
LKYQVLEEISIQSIRADKKIPISEVTLNQKQIEEGYFGQEMPVLLSKTPSVTWVSDGGHDTGYSYFRLRGIDQTRINFTLNGVPLNEPEDQGAYFSNYPDFLNSVRSIQVQRGVGISTNGTSAFGGSVNMESPSLFDSASVEINSSFGSYNTYRVSPEFNTGLLKNKWSFYGRFSANGSNGFRENSGTIGQSGFLSGGYKSKKGILKFTGFSGESNNQMSYLAVADSSLKSNYRANYLTKDEKDKFKQTFGMLQYICALNKKSQFTFSTYYTNLSGGYSILFPPDYYKFSVKSNFYGGIVNYQYSNKSLKVNAGINANKYVRYHFASFLNSENELFYKNAGHKNEVSAFTKFSYQVRKFNFYTDLQYRRSQFSYESDKLVPISIPTINWTFFNPKAGILFSIGKNSTIYSSIGKTSREPTRNDMFAGYDNIDSLNYIEIGSLNRVKPERVIDIEVGVKLQFKKWKIDANFYNMQFKNEIAAIGQLSYIGLPLRKNVASSYRRGIELNLTAEPIKNLFISTQVNLSDNKIASYITDYDSIEHINVTPLLTPQIIVNQSIAYEISKRISTEITGRYVGESFLENGNNQNLIVPSSFILNGGLSVKFYKNHSIQFLVNNITNQKYFSSGYVQGNQPYYFAMATRNFYISLKLKF